jgi:general stress protein 26
MAIRDYEDVTGFGLDAEHEEALIKLQNECVLSWTTKDGSSMAVIMSYLRTDDGHFWLTASGQRKRVAAIRRDPRVCIVITSTGTELRANKTVTYKCTAELHDDAETKAWFYPALAERLQGYRGEQAVKEFALMLDSPRRVIFELTPGLRVGYDGVKMGKATAEARAAGRFVELD